jgi:hypothetical protein
MAAMMIDASAFFTKNPPLVFMGSLFGYGLPVDTAAQESQALKAISIILPLNAASIAASC